MRESTEKIKREMLDRGITIDELARAVGLKNKKSLANIINGSMQSGRVQQEISNFLQVEIWPGVEITERVASLPAGTIVILPNDEASKKFVEQAGETSGAHERRNNIISIRASSQIRFPLSDDDTAK